jgi:hypothetical protein
MIAAAALALGGSAVAARRPAPRREEAAELVRLDPACPDCPATVPVTEAERTL